MKNPKIILLPDGLKFVDIPKRKYGETQTWYEKVTIPKAIKEGIQFEQGNNWNYHALEALLFTVYGKLEQGKLYDIPKEYQIKLKTDHPHEECKLECICTYTDDYYAFLEPITKQEPEKCKNKFCRLDDHNYCDCREIDYESSNATPVTEENVNEKLQKFDNMSFFESTPVIEQKRKSTFEIIKWKIGKIIGEKFLEYNDGKFHTAVELNPAIHAVAEFFEQYAESKQLTPNDGWISVKERLPECEGGDFFCYNASDKEYFIARFSERETDESHWHDSGYSVFPTHWMIPKPPKP